MAATFSTSAWNNTDMTNRYFSAGAESNNIAKKGLENTTIILIVQAIRI